MSIIHRGSCAVIPDYMLEHIAETEGPGRATAVATLAEMKKLSGQPRTLIETTPKATAPVAVLRRNVYDARNREKLPGTLVMSDQKPKRGKDAAVLEAWDGAGATHEFFKRVFRRDSIDGHGLRIDSTVHYGRQFTNAMWNGLQMVYGDGDGRFFNRFTASPEVIAHELTHGVTQFETGLGYEGQSGALNEHISDAFGIMVKQSVLRQKAAQSNWLIGEGLFAPGVKGRAVRSMIAPGTAYDDPRLGKDPQPAHMNQYVDTVLDHGGVHINSGILNRAFCLFSLSLGGYTPEVAGVIWYITVTDRVHSLDEFLDFADATTEVAHERFGPEIKQKLITAWRGVGLSPLARAARLLRRRNNITKERKIS